jgi:hypothetical protein
VKSSHRTLRQRRFKQSGLGTAENKPKRTHFTVTFVIGPQDLTPREYVTTDRRQALRVAKEQVQVGAPIVLVKKGTFDNGMKLVADFSTVGGAR